MNKFLKIDDLVINTEKIVTIQFYEVSGRERISIWMVNAKEGICLTGDKAERFRSWFDNHADTWNA